MLADPKAEALVTNFASEWLFLRNLQSVNPAGEDFPNFDDNLRQAFRRRDGTVLRQRDARRPQRARSAERELHVRQRAAGEALRHSEHLWQPVPPRHAHGRCAPRAARPGQHSDGDFLSRRELRRCCAASGFSKIFWERRRRRRRRTCRRSRRTTRAARSPRCASGWRSIARIRPARPATR